MVRETRHLWVGNLPENIREDRIRDHFKRYGRVQSVKLLPRAKDDEGSGACATVSFMDIKSASKAHNNEQKLEDRTLTTEYHEPAAIPGSATPIYSSQRFSHGPPEEISSFERSSHFYERERDRRDGDAYLRRASSTYHVTAAEPLRGRTRDRHYRNGPYAPIIESVVSRQPPHHRSVGSSWSYDTPSRYPQPSTTPDVYGDDRRDLTPVVVVHKKHTKSRSGSNGSESGSNSGSSVSRSRSSSSSSQSGSSSCSSASSSPASDKSCSTHSHHGSLRSGVTLQSAVSTPHTNNSSPAVHSDDRRPLAICVRNLPARSSDTSLKDGLFHEYKKHGKVTWVKVVGQGSDRYALVCFKKPDDVEKALQVSHDKLFFGCKIEVAPYQGYDVDDNEFRFVARPYEAEQDEFHPKATRTLFIGNLEKDITAPELRKHFDQFGEIIEIDIKKQGSNSSYAFCQYCDIGSVVRAMRTLDGEHLGNNRIKLGFGKSLHTNCVWVDGVAESVTEKYLSLQFSQFGPVSHVAIDRSRGHALVFYDQIGFAQSAVKEMRGVAVRGRKLQVDFASRECQEAFYDHLEKQTGHNTTFDNSVQVSPQGVTSSVTRGFETPSSSSSSSGGGTSRYPRYSTQPSVGRSYSRGTTNSAASPGASPSTPARSTPRHISTTPRFDFSTDYIPDRRPYRSYEEMSMEDGGGIVTVTVGQGPQDIRHLQKERVALLEQLEDCASSGEEGSTRRRCKHRRSHSGEGSRPGTPLCDERPENLPPVEPRRTPRERPPDPLSLPLPRFATQLMSPRPAPPSPPASPPRPQSTSSDDSEPSPPSPEWEERLRSLDEKYEKWSGSRTVMAKVDPSSLRVRHKLLDLDLHELQPSDIVKSVLAKRSVFDEDSKRLENFGEKYEPREFVPTRPGFTSLRPRLDSPLLHSPAAPKSPAAASSPAGAKGLQYPFPSHPPVQPTTSVATTTAVMSMPLCSSLSSGITTVSSNVSAIDSSKSPQTFPTTCTSTVSSVRQFQTPSSTFHPPPKISPPPPPLEKKTDNVDSLSRLSADKLKTSQKLSSNPHSEKVETTKKEPIITPTPLKPLKSCLRRESGDDRREMESRRRSRDEDGKVTCVLKSECEKGKETEGFERRRSLSDPRRRDSVDSNKDSFRSESVSDKIKDRNHKEERRRRDSVDNSAKKDAEVVDLFKPRLSDPRISEHSDTSECSKFTDSLTLNTNFDTRLDDNIRHQTTQATDTAEKKKDSLQVCPERDRRRGRDSVDSSSDNSRHRKVPEILDIKRELESDTRQRDSSTDKNDSSFKKSVEYIERRKDSGHSENPKNNEIFDRRKDKDNSSICLENTRHKEKKEQIALKKDKEGTDLVENSRHASSRKSPEVGDNLRHKDDTMKSSSFMEIARHRENNIRRDSESEENSQKISESKKELDMYQSSNYKDTSLKKEHFTEPSHCTGKAEEVNESPRQRDSKKENEPLAVRHRENSKHHDYSRHKESDKKKESVFDSLHTQHNELKKEEFTDTLHTKQSSFEYSQRVKEYERRKDSDKHDPRSKNNERTISDLFEHSKQKNSDKQSNTDPTSQISEWVEEIRKDLESSGFVKTREPVDEFDQVDCEKKNNSLLLSESYHNEDKKKGDNNTKIKEDNKKEDEFDFSHKENEKKKFIEISECRYYDRKKSSDTAEIFRRKELSRKKDINEIDNNKLKDFDKKRDCDFLENSKHKNLVERKKESSDRDRIKERDSMDYVNDNRQKDWHEEKHSERKSELEKVKKSNKDIECSEKECESDSNDNHKDELENCGSKEGDSLEHHDEENTRKNDFIKKEKKKERLNSWPAAIGCKRRLSSQDSLDICVDETKKCKPERRDSKDSGRSSSSSKKSTSDKHNKSFAKMLEEKIKEDKEREMNKKRKDDDISSEIIKTAFRKDKRNSGEKRKEDRKGKVRHKENGITASESEAGSGDDDSKTPKRHSIFDIVDEEPAYISMYDKVKARSTKNMQKQEEEKRQERLKEKFNQLKQSRAKREEKKRSTSYDEDSDSERGGRRSNKLMITSSEEDAGSEGDVRAKSRKIMSDTSEDDSHRHPIPPRIKPLRLNAEDIEQKPRKIMSDTSEDDTLRLSIARIKVARVHQEDLEPKLRKILSDTSEDDIMKHSISRNKPSRIQSDESEVDLGYEEQKKEEGFVKKTNDYAGSDLFSNISEDPEHPSQTDIEKEHNEQYHRNSIDSTNSDVPRKKSHKKKQKRQKNSEEMEDGNGKRHNSKKDRRKSSHSHDGDEDQSGQTKIRKKKSDRDSSSKRDEKMEDIFGPLSDDSDKVHNKWHVSQIYGSDSDEERQVMRKRDKRRKERKARELDEAGRVLEAKLMDNSENFPISEDFTKAKKKKRKKSREEKISKHHQQRLEEEAAALANEADSEREPEPAIPPPSLPRLMDSPPPCVSQNKKPDIPGFGSQVDENIHETAVKSISESPTKPIEEKREPIEESLPPTNAEDKPTPVISQEETEDAVAALLLEDSFGGGFESYTKPDTPVSEPDLQIDTDTEDTFDPIDFSRPPRTPDIPTSFYRQQDTREGLEERILALACPDNSSNKQRESGSSPTSPSLSVHVSDYKNDRENKMSDKKTVNDTSLISASTEKDAIKPNKNDNESKEETNEKSAVAVEAGKRHDLPPLVCQSEVSHVVQPIKVSFSELKPQITSDQNLSKLTVAKIITSEKPSVSLASQVQAKVLPTPLPPPLVHATNQLPKSASSEVHLPTSLTPSSSSQSETSRNVLSVQSQLNHPTVFSVQHEIHKNKMLHTQSAIQESSSEKPILTPKSVSQIIVTPPTSVALIVQTQSKVPQPSQQNSSVLQLSTKLHSPGSQQVDIKGNAQIPQYVLHHTLQPSQIVNPQQTLNKMPNQQSGLSNQGAPGQIQGTQKLTVTAMPASAKSPIMSVSTKSPGLSVSTAKSPIQSTSQEQQYKQIVLNHPHNQQLSVNVSHNHHLNTNILLSPNQQVNISHSPAAHHSPAGLSFSPHHMKVSIAQQTNNIHPNTIQLSPSIHHQQVSPLASHQQKHIQQHSPAIQQNTGQLVSPNQQQNKNSTPLLQQVPNCIGSIPVKLCSPTKPGTVHTVRHLSPVSQSNPVNKMNAHVLQTSGVQQVRAVVLQNPVKQTVTLLQPQVVQKPLGSQMIRPLNAPQPQVVHTLKSDPPVLEKSKHPSEITPTVHSQKNDVYTPVSKLVQKPCEEPLSLTASKRDDAPNPVKMEKQISSEAKAELIKEVKIENEARPVVDDIKPLNAVIQDLTYKAVQAKQASLNSSNQLEDLKSNIPKPLDQVVQEIHDRKKAAEPKEVVKSDEKCEPVKSENNITLNPEVGVKKEIKSVECEGENIKEEKEDELKVKDELKEVESNINKDIKSAVENKAEKVNEKVTETSSEIAEPDTIKQEEEPKVEKIRIKKEENGLCVDPVPSSCTSKTEKPSLDVQKDMKMELTDDEIKPDDAVDKHVETGENKEEPQVIKDEVLTSSRGRGGRRRKASGRAGGVVTRRARLNNSTASANDMASADVYEFRDDSEEEANRPRLILTIKSPSDPAPPPSNNSASTRKSRRLQEKDGSRNTVDDTIEDVIRGTRSGGRRTTRTSANCAATPVMETRKSPRRKQSAIPPPPAVVSTASEVKSAAEVVSDAPLATPQPPPPPQPPPQAQAIKPPSTEPMTLIDPVTGLLIPMRESEEGQYIPVNTVDHVRPPLDPKEESGEPAEKRMRTTLPTESESSLLSRPGIPVKVPPNCAVVPPLPPKPSITSELPRPIISHTKPPVATKTTGIVVPSGIPRPTTTLANPVALNKPLSVAAPSLVKPCQGVMMSPTGVNKASVTNVVGPMTINRVAAPPSVSPSGKPVIPLSISAPLNHKTHLLQAVAHRGKVPVAKVPTPMTPKAHILHSMSSVVAREGMVGPGTPPPSHHGPLLTGSVASPPLRAPHLASQQPVVTGASSTRVVCKGLMEPLKVEPGGGCIVVPTASPQSRSQVMQAGLPVPAYEASLCNIASWRERIKMSSGSSNLMAKRSRKRSTAKEKSNQPSRTPQENKPTEKDNAGERSQQDTQEKTKDQRQQKPLIIIMDFDFTITQSNSGVIVQQLLPRGNITDEIIQLFKEKRWLTYNNTIYSKLHDIGTTVDEILQAIKAIRPNEGIPELMQWLHTNHYEIIVLSDCNKLFVEEWMRHYDLMRYISNIFCNNAVVSTEGKLTIHPPLPSPKCIRGDLGMCKRHTLEAYLENQKTLGVTYNRKLYIGDGINDLQPVKQLKARDWVFVREGFGLYNFITKPRLASDPPPIRCLWHPWNAGSQIQTKIEQLLNEG